MTTTLDAPDLPSARTDRAAPRDVLARAAAAGLMAAILVPGQPVGAGTAVAALAVALAASGSPRWRSPSGMALAAVAAALVLVAGFRDASWLVALCLLAALVAWSTGLSDARGWVGAVRGAAAVPLAWLPALPWLLRPVGGMGSRERRTAAAPALRGAAAALVLLAVFGTLFATADAAFRELVGRWPVPEPGPLLPGRVLVLIGAAGLVAAAVRVAAAPPASSPPSARAPLPVRRVEWVLPLLLLDVLVAAFVTVQLAVLFGGRDHVLSTAGLTYAEYARQGFAQLIAAAVLTLAVVAVAMRVVPRSPRNDRVLRALLGVLCLLTLVVLASASRRLGLYEQEFGFTRLRLSVDAAIAWLGVVFLLVLAAGVRLRGAWLPRAIVLSAAAGLLVFAVSNPDARIAERNVERYEATGNVDTAYLARLSADAVPALLQLPEPERSCVLAELSRPSAGAWTSVNLSRLRAERALRAAALAGCPR